MKRTTLICLLDKPYPPDHSFVTGMLAQALPRDGDVRVQLLVMAPEGGPLAPQRYHHAACLPMIPDFSRQGNSRVLAMLTARRLARALIHKARRRGERVVLFVRNHPALLLVAASLTGRADRLVFQSSFPLERQGNIARRGLHQAALRIGGRRVDGVLAVSPLGLERTRKLCRPKTPGVVIPLLSDLPKADCADFSLWRDNEEYVRFIYVGSHAPDRKLGIILEAAVISLQAGENGCFAFVGGRSNEIRGLADNPDARPWIEASRIVFRPPVPRSLIPGFLASADCGLSLIPDQPLFREASPTKMAEYLGAGLCTLGSYGPELQEEFIRGSNAGLLVKFAPQEIARGLSQIMANPSQRRAWSKNALLFSRARLDYRKYVKPFLKITRDEVCIHGPAGR